MSTAFHLVRRDPSRNVARFYRLELCPTLFGDIVLVRHWGRIGTSGRRREVPVSDVDDGQAALELWYRRKLERGYRIWRPVRPS